MEESNANLTSDVKWAQVPEWIIVAPISDRAVRLYALLARRANGDSQAFPSRGYLAEKMACSRKSVDRALEELLNLRAISKQQQFSGNRQTVNLYTLHAMAGTPVTIGGDTGDAGGRDTGDAQNESHKNESHREHLAATPKKQESPRPKDELFETVAEVCGINLTNMTRSARGQLNRATKELRDIQATTEQIHAKAKAYRTQYPNATLTPTALTKHWSSFANIEKQQARPSIWDTYNPPKEYYG